MNIGYALWNTMEILIYITILACLDRFIVCLMDVGWIDECTQFMSFHYIVETWDCGVLFICSSSSSSCVQVHFLFSFVHNNKKLLINSCRVQYTFIQLISPTYCVCVKTKIIHGGCWLSLMARSTISTQTTLNISHHQTDRESFILYSYRMYVCYIRSCFGHPKIYEEEKFKNRRRNTTIFGTLSADRRLSRIALTQILWPVYIDEVNLNSSSSLVFSLYSFSTQ